MSAENRKPRLHRLDRVFVHSPIYFVTACTHQRRKILATARVHEAFLDFARRGPGHGAWVGAYVIMPDRLRLFVSLDDQKIMLSAWMKTSKNTASKALGVHGRDLCLGILSRLMSVSAVTDRRYNGTVAPGKICA